MYRSRRPRWRGALDQQKQAIGRSCTRTRYFRCSPTGRTRVPEVVCSAKRCSTSPSSFDRRTCWISIGPRASSRQFIGSHELASIAFFTCRLGGRLARHRGAGSSMCPARWSASKDRGRPCLALARSPGASSTPRRARTRALSCLHLDSRGSAVGSAPPHRRRPIDLGSEGRCPFLSNATSRRRT